MKETNTIKPRSKYIPALVFILIITLAAYSQLFFKGFTSSDDFVPIYYAIHYDIPHPISIFLTPYFLTYRPIPRLINILTLLLPVDNGLFFNIKNISFLLISVFLVFTILHKLDLPISLSLLGALLFSIHPAEVNSVGVSVFPNAFITLLFLLILFVFLGRKTKFRDIGLVFLTFLGVLTYEAFLIVPVIFFVVYGWRFYKKHESNDLVFSLIHLFIIPIYFIIRLNATGFSNLETVMNSSQSVYGLKNIPEIIQNIGMLIFGSGNIVDFVWFINPVTQTLPTTIGSILESPTLIPIIIACIFSLVTLGGVIFSLLRWIKNRDNKYLLPPIFYILFILSFLLQAIGSRASETYLGVSIAFLAISQVLLINNIFLNKRKKSIGIIVLLSLIFILGVRFLGVWHRTTILVENSSLVSYMGENLTKLNSELRSGLIFYTSPCKDDKGYSIYGVQSIDAIGEYATEFTYYYLQRDDIKAKRIEYNLINIDELAKTNQIIVIDLKGDMGLWQEAFIPNCSYGGP